jgi:CheY-like chemotaxis protein
VDFRTVLADLFRDEGYTVHTAADGGQALGEIAGASFNVILTDLTIPGMDGYALLRILRTRGISIPLVAMTADTSPPRVPASIPTLRKPFDIDTVLAAIERVLHAD